MRSTRPQLIIDVVSLGGSHQTRGNENWIMQDIEAKVGLGWLADLGGGCNTPKRLVRGFNAIRELVSRLP
jgi:hypothetical protein